MIDWLVGTLIASSALMALVLVVREPVRSRFGPAVAYALWLIPAARMMLPPLVRTVERTVPEAPLAPASLATGLPSAPDAVTSQTLTGQLISSPALLIAVWLAGAAAMLAFGWFQYLAQRRAILGSSVPLARIGSIRLLRCERVRGPMAFGIIDRAIVIPFDFDDRFSERQRCLALDHELAHHRSFDLVANLVAFVLLCLQWFNPLAWAAYAAFRFDQEAACDARVLDKVDERDRESYGQAIAKAASGRALLFAGALDRPSTLSRRLMIMAHAIPRNTRTLGFGLVGGAVLAALPLTATWAVVYTDVGDSAAPAPAIPALPRAQAQTIPAAAPVPATPVPATLGPSPALPPAVALASAAVPEPAMHTDSDGSLVLPGGVKLDKGSTAFFGDDRIFINGKVMTLDQATPAERARIRDAIAKSLRSIERERARLPRQLAEARRELERIRNGDFKREILSDREDLRRDLAEVTAEAAELRANGENPEKLKAEILKALREAEAIDIDKEIRRAMEEANPDKIVAELRKDEEQMKRMQARLDQLDRGGNR